MRTSSFAFGTLIVLISCLTTTTAAAAATATLPTPNFPHHTPNSPISSADAYGCKIVENTIHALAKPQYKQQSQTTYSCTPVNSSTRFEVHVLSMYEVINRRPPVAGYATVNFVSDGKSDRPIILVLGSHEPVNWILNLPADVTITKVILISYYIVESSVGGDVNQVQAIKGYGYRYDATWRNWGYGSASSRDTVGFLKEVYDRIGVVTSFTGTYKADEWSLMLSSARRQSTGQSTPVTIPVRSEVVGPVYNTRAQSSACVSAYKSGEKLSGFMIVTIMITVIQYAW